MPEQVHAKPLEAKATSTANDLAKVYQALLEAEIRCFYKAEVSSERAQATDRQVPVSGQKANRG